MPWSRHLDEKTGAWYEWDSATNELRWETPAADVGGWRQERDPSSGYAYWWNPVTNQRQWHAPPGAAGAATAPPASAPSSMSLAPLSAPSPAFPHPKPPAGPKPPAALPPPAGPKPPAAMPPPSWTPEEEQARKQAAKQAAKQSVNAPPAAAAAAAFVPAPAFAGARPGYVFKSGARGVGYYLEVAASASSSATAKPAPPVASKPAAHQPAVAAAASSEVSLDPGEEAEPASVEQIEELISERAKAKAAKDYAAADELRDQLLYECGVTVDDKSRTWQCTDGRRGQLEGGRRGAILPAKLAAMPGVVDSRGNVNAKAAAKAASAAAAGWGRSGVGAMPTAAPQPTASSRVPIKRSFQPPAVKKRPGEQLLLQSSAKTGRHGFTSDE